MKRKLLVLIHIFVYGILVGFGVSRRDYLRIHTVYGSSISMRLKWFNVYPESKC